MKALVLVASIFFSFATFSSPAFAASQFTVAGSKIQAIFASEKIWRRLGGEVESIRYMGHSVATGVSKFEVNTTENISIVDGAGRTTGWVPHPCKVVVDVAIVGDPMMGQWEVTDVDFGGCPKTMM